MLLENVLLTSVLDFNDDVDILVQNSEDLPVRGTWQDGLVELSELYQVLKVEWQVKHPYDLTRISSHHHFLSKAIRLLSR